MTPDARFALERTRALLLAKRWDPTACARDAEGKRIEAMWPAASYSLCGALTHACAGDDKLDAHLTVKVLGSGEHGLTRPQQLTHWENEPGRTLEEVIGLIDQALAVQEPPKTSSAPVLVLVQGGAQDEEPVAQKGLFE